MRCDNFSIGRGLVLLAIACCAGTAAMAEKPDWAGQGGAGKKNEDRRDDRREDRHEERRGAPGSMRPEPQQRAAITVGVYFGDLHRAAVREHYEHEFRAGKGCPPGLAKKHNGCLPPGQLKPWKVGRPLPPGVIYYAVAPQVLVRLGPAPAGHQFVRVASDILLIAIGTGMVIDAIEDLGRQ